MDLENLPCGDEFYVRVAALDASSNVSQLSPVFTAYTGSCTGALPSTLPPATAPAGPSTGTLIAIGAGVLGLGLLAYGIAMEV